jgi:AbrB family looped-hinge helix DNA binding protein
MELQVTVDRFGRVVIPKAIRNDLGLSSGSVLAIEETEKGILLRVVGDEPNVIDKNGVLVFTGAATGDLGDAVRTHRDSRLQSIQQPHRKRR